MSAFGFEDWYDESALRAFEEARAVSEGKKQGTIGAVRLVFDQSGGGPAAYLIYGAAVRLATVRHCNGWSGPARPTAFPRVASAKC